MKVLLEEIRQCKVCLPDLTHGVNPVVNVSQKSKIAIVGQAPGRLVHASGIPWKDKSGDRLREWMCVENKSFYNPGHFAIVPMGFCYPGKGKTGDLPPRAECAPLWHKRLFDSMPDLKLILLIGTYAQHYYLGKAMKKTLTETVRQFQDYSPLYFPLPHPSPRNNIWMKKNSWFEEEVLPVLKIEVKKCLLG